MSKHKRPNRPSSNPDPGPADLARTAAAERQIVGRFGFVPCSVLHITRGELSRRMFTLQRERVERTRVVGGHKIRVGGHVIDIIGHPCKGKNVMAPKVQRFVDGTV